MPRQIIRAFAVLKKAALTNPDAGVLLPEKSDLIGRVCNGIMAGQHAYSIRAECRRKDS